MEETTNANRIFVPAGSKIATPAGRIQITEDTDVPAELLPDSEPQQNPRIGIVCKAEPCREFQRSKLKGKLFVAYVLPGNVAKIGGVYPFCPVCSQPMAPATEADIQKRKSKNTPVAIPSIAMAHVADCSCDDCINPQA